MLFTFEELLDLETKSKEFIRTVIENIDHLLIEIKKDI